jgi:hypothetical protein
MLQLSCPGGRTNVVPAMDTRTRDVKVRFTQRTSRLRRFPLEQCIATLPRRTKVGVLVDVIA